MADSQLLAGSDAAFTGFWTDFDRSERVRGATLTLRNRDATILLSFLAVLVGLCANRSWKIWRLILVAKGHGLQSLSQRRKELQVILRNSETTGATIGALFALLSTPSELVKRSDRLRSIALVSMAVLHMALFLAAGIMTSQIVFGRVVTSRVTPSCGQWLPSLTQTSQEAWWGWSSCSTKA